MRSLQLEEIHAEAVRIGRSRKGLRKTANRLAGCNVDPQISAIVARLKPAAWRLPDQEIINACAMELWLQFLQAEINIQAP